MPAKNPWQTDTNHLNNAGLDVIHPVDQVDKDHYSRMEDVKSLQEGSITPRPGTSLINAIAFDAGAFTELSMTDETAKICVTAGAPADTYGSAVEFFASAGFAVKFITITVQTGGSDGTFEFEVMSGPGLGTTEAGPIVLIQNTTGGIVNFESSVLSFPVNIAAGSRIGIRLRDKLATLTTQCFTMHLYG